VHELTAERGVRAAVSGIASFHRCNHVIRCVIKVRRHVDHSTQIARRDARRCFSQGPAKSPVFLRSPSDRWAEFDRLARLRVDIIDATGAFFDAIPYPADAWQERSPLMHRIRQDSVELRSRKPPVTWTRRRRCFQKPRLSSAFTCMKRPGAQPIRQPFTPHRPSSSRRPDRRPRPTAASIPGSCACPGAIFASQSTSGSSCLKATT
jgi:hypothetical protein